MDRIRAFIAFKIPESVLCHIRSIQETLAAGGISMRWTPVENVHLTLKFLGDIRPTAVESIFEAMTGSVQAAFPLRFSAKGLGVFPGIHRPRVLWIGLKGDTALLIDLQRRLDVALEALGFAPELRSFKAHLTIGRARGPLNPQKLALLLASAGSAESPQFSVDKLILFQSELYPRGPIYTELKTAVLAG
ncbi:MULTISPECIES: RNA 2',3'-cyclic phosphodiesterase [Desulfococcus]|uniref:RNA 2',3'-cyclic phosphodiesterase n=1 Tax=Desulfococcus multivorans DSM 2059 TaxID=1121405 RepID=S7UXE5_DESML|nr:RNA 2',3'-cyclic phosphodiesterase [Desulfococcus multivorans]EPR38884.1 2'-5' RNA ligase [Desulfococcus multivorans DSM 2059]MDX9818594.1 RNA 2',3'-cyclic phosphodiesterase [Desulfococcus multivorans]SJZ68079.1 2'-5' RNA ligase [Desulfococcus multivorans DSM 2059]